MDGYVLCIYMCVYIQTLIVNILAIKLKDLIQATSKFNSTRSRAKIKRSNIKGDIFFKLFAKCFWWSN